MADTNLKFLYKEARLNLEPAYPGSVIDISMPSQISSTFGSRAQPKRTIASETYIDEDEEAFAKRHLAKEASVFFRRPNKYPRSFLWRVLDDRKVLELQSIDLEQDADNKHEANLTLLFRFPTAIRPFGIAFAEPEDRDAVIVFAITTSNELYTLTLSRDFFAKAAASEVEVGDWCKTFIPSSLSVRKPYRLIAVDANELLVSLDDGAIQKLTKKNGNDGSLWSEISFREHNWSLKGLVSWRGNQTIKFNNVDLDTSTPASLALSPDGQHIFSVCLNHVLKVWNATTGRIAIQKDLLDEIDPANEKNAAPYFIGPSQSMLMQIIDLPGGLDGAQYHVLTYSPKKHQFKFWGIRDADDAELGISDVHSDVNFIPPVDELMSTSVWNLEEFHFKPGPAGWRASELWIRARSGPVSKVYSLTFDLHDEDSVLEHVWKEEWVSVDSGPLTVEGLKSNPANPGELGSGLSSYNPSTPDQWLDFLFFPGRFTAATLETALFVYRRVIGQRRDIQLPSKGPLKERICATVSAHIALQKTTNRTLDYDEYEEAISAQWQMYYGLVRDLHKRRGESLSLVFDRHSATPWLVFSDGVAAIRKCSEIEIMRLNNRIVGASRKVPKIFRTSIHDDAAPRISKLLNAAAALRNSLPPFFRHRFAQEVQVEVRQSQLVSVVDRMTAMESSCDLYGQISEEDLSSVVEELGTELGNITNTLFYKVIEFLGQEPSGRAKERKQITRFGLHALSRVAHETLEINYDILLDLTVLILYMQLNIEPDDISEDFNGQEVFMEVVNQLKDYGILLWLSKTAWSRPAPTGVSSESTLKMLNESFNSGRLPIAQTVLEGIYGISSHKLPLPSTPSSDFLTHWARMWISEPFKDKSYEEVSEYIMGILLLQKEYDLASEFAQFLEESNWATYLKGRMYLAKGEHTPASNCFQKASFNLARGMFNLEDCDTISFISLEQRDFFSEGLSKYYLHVLGLFEKSKAYSFVAYFAKLGLQSLTVQEEENTKSELLCRLFNAAIQTSRFDEAYSAMSRHINISLRRSALMTLITTMVTQSQGTALLNFPFANLHNDVDNILTSLCQKTLNMSSGPPYHKILYAFRISRNDFRGAATTLYERLQRLQTTSSKVRDPADESLIQCYLVLINTLASVGQDEQWILAEQRIDDSAPPTLGSGRAKVRKRHIVSIDDLRREYQDELDRIAAIENGQFPFVDGNDEMDIL